MLYIYSGVFLHEYTLVICSELFTLAIVNCSNTFIISKFIQDGWYSSCRKLMGYIPLQWNIPLQL